MIVPSKFTSFDKSILAKISHLIVDVEEISVSNLFYEKIGKFKDPSEFIMAMDVLYALGKIELNTETGMVRYVS